MRQIHTVYDLGFESQTYNKTIVSESRLIQIYQDKDTSMILMLLLDAE